MNRRDMISQRVRDISDCLTEATAAAAKAREGTADTTALRLAKDSLSEAGCYLDELRYHLGARGFVPTLAERETESELTERYARVREDVRAVDRLVFAQGVWADSEEVS